MSIYGPTKHLYNTTETVSEDIDFSLYAKKQVFYLNQVEQCVVIST